MSITMKLPKVPEFKITTAKANEDTATISVNVIDKDFGLVFKNLEAVNTLTKFAVARAIASIAIDLLAESQPRVPYFEGSLSDTYVFGKYRGSKKKEHVDVSGKASSGKLRLSGRAVMQYGRGYKDIAWGGIGGNIIYDISLVTRAAAKSATKFGALVFYNRDWGETSGNDGIEGNLAYWLHENLQPHDARSMKIPGDGMYFARGKGTGPKYLEGPFIQKKAAYVNHLYKVVNNIGKVIPLITKFDTSKGKHRADRTEIIVNRIEEMGFFFDFK